ncbi:methylthioribulose 1-phosphate dehydratase [Gluconobacter wancherniae]|uniref:Methylthioribulose-1-phosphate dehydratase n=1 Tax=Gluconobacter wancherniae NBRC 103581 TaxID=656744 RepID=A0A511B7I6_9PROT|nr:methylthioribulose 1-phosphate dehydratase [Gluconobacter wancherniae]MBF0854388.1 methylthioribulose 1-phosphate dehydratase [Gluconobacter wancherniae]MBS1062784.1 methylthioribulose 1-phosphate dehydratase [Gluconobacter wancherniae]GBD57449.1 methylthioribulose-1-phosphate dehydratase [Gluconobacter wancherniae NBRC 103581]GBR62682.1 methylthioribulose-1-phosphate dehydratase [Gluconobacter wancherniae NBRC 103581]GEK93777.1 methylthioribulose-1-phosphate dehydratase [Gluconobacter wanc
MSGTIADPAWVEACQQIMQAGRRMDARGWVPATAGNLSCRLADGRIAITRSGGHKGFLSENGVIEIDPQGTPLNPGDRASAETLLHTQLYAHDASIGAVLHGHSVAATVLSMDEVSDAITLADYEILKVFEGQKTHETSLELPLFHNDQDIARLATVVAPVLADMKLGYLIRGHGVYVWGPDMPTALARLEGLEFLLACHLARQQKAH